MKNINFINLCKMSQAQLKKHVANELTKTHNEVISDDGFVFAQGTFPVLLVAHLDTVHKSLPESIVYNAQKQSISSPQGIGGDDRCGVYMIFEVLKKFNCSVLFCEDEEVGGKGADKFTESQVAKTFNANYIIEFDRKGNNDAVFYDCDNHEFEEFITKEFYKSAWGTFSDISYIAPYLGIAAVNLSCGYYNAHTANEYIVIPEMNASIEAACKILERTTEADKFEYIEARYGSYGWYDEWDAWSDYYSGTKTKSKHEDVCYIIEYYNDECVQCVFYTLAESEAEALGKFMIERPDRCFNDISDIYTDANMM